MAETITARPTRQTPASGRRLAPYRTVLAARIRSQRSYRSNFALDLASSLLVGFVELAEVWILFHNVHSLGGFTFAQILLVFGIADFAFSIADLFFGHCDRLPTYVRAGTLDVFYLRPQPILLQLITSEISLRRLSRAALGVTSLMVALVINDIRWSPAHAGLLACAIVCAIAMFSAMFVWAAGLQFFLVSGAELTNAFVYGGRYSATQPAAVWSRPLKVVFGFLFPMAFAAYLPALQLLGLPGPEWLPAWLGWCTPLAAAWAWTMALITWRTGMRHYRGGGG